MITLQSIRNWLNKNKFLSLSFLFFLGISLIIYLLLRPSERLQALENLDACVTVEDVKQNWGAYKNKLQKDPKYLHAVRTKIASLNLSNEEMKNIKTWLPNPPAHLNLIIVPDLSRRLIDSRNNPEQVNNDLILLNYLYEEFYNQTRLKINSKDRLIVDVTDQNQAQGNSRTLANNLIFDLSEHRNKSNRLYFESENVKGRFSTNINALYQQAIKRPLGADYWYYFNRMLSKNLKKSTLFDQYRNVVVIITDGYLESEKTFFTGNAALQKNICNQMKTKRINEIFQQMKLQIPPCNIDLSDTEILILEVQERREGQGCHYDILQKYWKDWFVGMNVKNAQASFFIQRNDATDLTQKIIQEFFQNPNF